MKLSNLIKWCQKALDEHGDMDLNVHYLPGDNCFVIDDEDFDPNEEEGPIYIDSREGLVLRIG